MTVTKSYAKREQAQDKRRRVRVERVLRTDPAQLPLWPLSPAEQVLLILRGRK